MTAAQDPVARFLESVAAVLESDVTTSPGRRAAAGELLRAMARPGILAASHVPSTLPTCWHLDAALEGARRGGTRIAALAQAFSDLAPMLAWRRRAGSRAAGPSFHDGHANAIVLGPDGMHRHADVKVGATLMRPRVQYPVHRHPPREFYLVLSDGDWFNESDGWYTPGVGAIVYHRSGIEHAMRAGDAPLLALWCLCRATPG